MAGADAETGTEPDSAPQYPLKVSIVSPVATIFVSETRGVPTMSTPRTSSIGAAVRVHFVNDQRLHLKRLRLAAAGERKSTGDIVNQQAKRFSLALDFLDQFFAQLGVGYGEAALEQSNFPAAKPAARRSGAGRARWRPENP